MRIFGFPILYSSAMDYRELEALEYSIIFKTIMLGTLSSRMAFRISKFSKGEERIKTKSNEKSIISRLFELRVAIKLIFTGGLRGERGKDRGFQKKRACKQQDRSIGISYLHSYSYSDSEILEVITHPYYSFYLFVLFMRRGDEMVVLIARSCRRILVTVHAS